MTHRMILAWTVASAILVAFAFFDAARAFYDPTIPRSCAEWTADGDQGPRIVEDGHLSPRQWTCEDTAAGIAISTP